MVGGNGLSRAAPQDDAITIAELRDPAFAIAIIM
jgi:hypothetical protein